MNRAEIYKIKREILEIFYKQLENGYTKKEIEHSLRVFLKYKLKEKYE